MIQKIGDFNICNSNSIFKGLDPGTSQSWGGTQLWVGYGCAARSFDHHPITKPEKTQICYLYQNHSFLEGPFLKPISAFYNVKLGCISTFWQPIDKPKDKFIGNYAFCKNATYIKTNFQIKKGPLQNLRARKSTLSGPHIPVPTFPLSTPRGLNIGKFLIILGVQVLHENVVFCVFFFFFFFFFFLSLLTCIVLFRSPQYWNVKMF